MSNDIFTRINDDDVMFFAGKKRGYTSKTPQALTALRWLAIETVWSRHRVGQLEAQVEVLESTIARLSTVCDAAFTMVRDDGAEDGWTTWQELVSALEDANYQPRTEEPT